MALYRILSGGLHGRYEGDDAALQRDLTVYGPATMADGRPRPSHDTDGNLNPGFIENEDGSVTARDVVDLSDAEAKSPSFRGRIQKLEVQPDESRQTQQQPAKPVSSPAPARPASQTQPPSQQKGA